MITCNETIYQWDVSRTVDVDTDCEVHFALQGEPQALVVASALGKAEIPNVLLQDGRDIIAWQVQEDKTVETKRIAVMRRAKPADYVYTETEIITFETLVAEVREAVAKSLEQTERAKQAVSTIEKTNADIQQAETKRAEEFKAMGAKTDAGIAKMNKAESDVRQAEEQRAVQEFSRTQAEAKREESFTSNLTSWNQKVDAEVAKTSQAITETNKAKDNAITATNKANEAIAQLPLPTGNVLKGEVQGIIAHADDVYTSKALGFNIYGKSSQYTTTGANLADLGGIWIDNNGATHEVTSSGTVIVRCSRGWARSTLFVPIPQANQGYVCSAAMPPDATHRGVTFGVANAADGTGITKVQGLNPSNGFCAKVSVADEKYFAIAFYGNNTAEIGDFEMEYRDVMLAVGSAAVPYEPYTGGKPSPSPDYPRDIVNVKSADLSIAGKNLVEKAIVDSHTARFATVLKLKMKLSPSTQYCLSFEDVKDNAYYLNETVFEYQRIVATGSRQFLLVRTKDVLDKSNSLQFDSINGCWLVLRNDKEQSNAPQFKNVQFELGSDNTPYEAPSKPITLPINLQGNELCSLPNGVRDEVRIDKDGNVELVKRVGVCPMPKAEVVGDGNTQVGADGTHNRVVSFLPPANAASGNGASCVCTHFADGGTTKNRDTIRFGANNSHIYVYTSDADVIGDGTKEAVDAWMAANNVKLLYPLATPIITSLGKVDMPTLPAPVCNAWANDENPTDVKFSYIRDVNIAYEKLASALANAMNTPATIPELEL